MLKANLCEEPLSSWFPPTECLASAAREDALKDWRHDFGKNDSPHHHHDLELQRQVFDLTREAPAIGDCFHSLIYCDLQKL